MEEQRNWQKYAQDVLNVTYFWVHRNVIPRHLDAIEHTLIICTDASRKAMTSCAYVLSNYGANCYAIRLIGRINQTIQYGRQLSAEREVQKFVTKFGKTSP